MRRRACAAAGTGLARLPHNGGTAVFEKNALKGRALGLGLAFGLTALVEASRYLLRLLRSRSGGRGADL